MLYNYLINVTFFNFVNTHSIGFEPITPSLED